MQDDVATSALVFDPRQAANNGNFVVLDLGECMRIKRVRLNAGAFMMAPREITLEVSRGGETSYLTWRVAAHMFLPFTLPRAVLRF